MRNDLAAKYWAICDYFIYFDRSAIEHVAPPGFAGGALAIDCQLVATLPCFATASFPGLLERI